MACNGYDWTSPLHQYLLLSMQKPSQGGLLQYKEPGSDLLSHAKSILSSARSRFTVLFEMGRGGSNSLWPPGINGKVVDSS